jgi:hypothetical protein
MEQEQMRMTVLLPIAAALTAVAIGSSDDVFARSRGPAVRDHRPAPVVRDHRPTPVVRDHRPTPVVRDHRTSAGRGGVTVTSGPVRTTGSSKVYRVNPQGRKVIRAGRNYDKSTKFRQVIVNGKRVPRRVDAGPIVRDHRR